MANANQNILCRGCGGNGMVSFGYPFRHHICPICGGSGKQLTTSIGVASKDKLCLMNCDSRENWGKDPSWMKAPEPRKGFRQPKTSKHRRQKQNYND